MGAQLLRRLGLLVSWGLVVPGVVAAAPPPAAAVGSVVFVRAGASGSADGTSWADAFPELQAGLANAAAGDSVWVAAGTYHPTTGTDRAATFSLVDGVAVYGGFAGTETALGQRRPALHPSVLSGEIGVPGDVNDNSYSVVTASQVSASAVLDGFTVSGGNGGPEPRAGGGISVLMASPTLRNLVVRDNTSTFGGGIDVYGAPATVVLANLLVADNVAETGAGLYTIDSAVEVVNSTFTGNLAGSSGSVLTSMSGSVALTNVTVGGMGSAAAFYIEATSFTMRDSIVWPQAPVFGVFTAPTPLLADSIVAGGCPARVDCLRVTARNPRLDPLDDNGGAVPTRALGEGSRAIDAGDESTCADHDARGVRRPQGWGCDLGAYEVRALRLRSQARYDGWVLESTEQSEVGGTVDASAKTARVGDDARDRQYRAVFSFDTGRLPDHATAVRTELSFELGTEVGDPLAWSGGYVLQVRSPYFGKSRALQPADFQAPGAVTDGRAVASAPRGAAARLLVAAPVSTTSSTQFRLRFVHTDDDDHRADYLAFLTGDAPVAHRPTLWIYYNP